MKIEKYSIGIGDRFGRQGRAQLSALAEARKRGVDVVPVWNKSNREHSIIGTKPGDVRNEADSAVKALGWKQPYHVDADHIGLKTVDGFVAASDFFTLDVADYIGKPADDNSIRAFVAKHGEYAGTLRIPGVSGAMKVTEKQVETIAGKFLFAVQEAGRIYRHVEAAKGKSRFVTEVSFDESDVPQTPVEMFFILAAIADEGIPAQTIAPKFTGRFNKGVDYVGDVKAFEKEFNDDIAVVAFVVKKFGLPSSLKLSVHSGSDKFSIYGPIRKALQKTGAGLHLKTAGTTWLEELCGLAEAGGEGLEIAKEVYAAAHGRLDEMCKPYATVIDVNPARLPKPETVEKWSGAAYAAALRHDPSCKGFNPSFRQLLHVGYKVAAEMGERYLKAVERYEAVVAKGVCDNLLERHILKVFPAG
ncbi:MAG: hypothetical protein C0404_01895 [Verrucomicrobia bacterium]|nr:hypothetical protein [Verrucomicrobiota bacterium]